MKLSNGFMMIVLAVSILSYGIPGASFAQEDGEDDSGIVEQLLPITISTDSETYEAGDTITISGQLKTISNLMSDVTIIVDAPNNPAFIVAQPTPAMDGSFTKTVFTGGSLWKVSGEYTITATYLRGVGDSINAVGTFTFTAAGEEPPEEITCPEGQVLEDGACVDEVVELECAEGEKEVDGECVSIAPPPPECAEDENLVNGECVSIAPPPLECGANQIEKNGECVDELTCGEGTIKNPTTGQCEAAPPKSGCLIATAAYGSELAPQVQLLREIRDNTLLSTESGTSFMGGFSQAYYSFSPTIADLERENPAFREAVKLFITPMLATLSIMTLAEEGSESQVLALGISVIALNLGMYIAAPAVVGLKIRGHFKAKDL